MNGFLFLSHNCCWVLWEKGGGGFKKEIKLMLLCWIIRWELFLIPVLSFILQGVELGPLEITINSLQKSIEARQQEIAELQQMWLRQQSELVQLTKDKDMQSVDVRKLKKQLTILSQKKIRTEGKSSLFII